MYANTLVGIFALLPFIPHLDLFNGAVSAKSLFLVVFGSCLLVLGAAYFLKKGERGKIAVGHTYVAAVAVLIAIVLSALFGRDFAHSLFGDSLRAVGVLLLAILGFVAFTSAQILREQDWQRFRYAVLGSGVGISLLTILGPDGLKFGSFLWLDLKNPGVTFANDTFAGLYLVLVIVVGILALVREGVERRKIAIVAGVLITAISPVLFGWQNLLTGNFQTLGSARASSFACLVLLTSTLVYLVVARFFAHRKREVAITLVSIITVLTVLGSLLLVLPGSVLQQKLRDDTTSARFITWSLSIDAILERPMTGWGIAEFDKAFESHFDPALYTKSGLVEVWFDKAHNVTIDTLVSVGIVGLLTFFLLTVTYLWTISRLYHKRKIESAEFMVLGIFPSIHLIQLQTGFDIAPTYALWILLGAYVLWLEREHMPLLKFDSRPVAIGLIGLGIFGFGYGITEFSRQQALVMSLSEDNAESRRLMIDQGLSRRSDFEGLHRSANLFVESVYKSGGSPNDALLTQATPYLEQYLGAYEKYLDEESDHYRARVNYAYLLLIYEAWGGEGAAKAEEVIRDSSQYSPRNPLTYVLHTMAFVMLNDLAAAEKRLGEAEELFGPGIKILEDTRAWVSRQKEEDAKHSLLRIGNI